MLPTNLGSWIIGSKLGQGAFSSVYEATYTSEGLGKLRPEEQKLLKNHQWVLKISPALPEQPPKRKKKNAEAQGATLLHVEYTTYRILRENGVPIPAMPISVRDQYQTNCNGWSFLAIQRFDKTLEDRGILDDADFFKVSSRLAGLLQSLHQCGFAYRDLKPENIMVDESDEIFIVDMGAAVRFILPDGSRNKSPSNPAGTPKYMSVNVHQGAFASGRDDLESLCYMLLRLYDGSLPWDSAQSDDSILKTKIKITPDELTRNVSNAQIREVLCQWLHYVRSLSHDDSIDYEMFFVKYVPIAKKSRKSKDTKNDKVPTRRFSPRLVSRKSTAPVENCSPNIQENDARVVSTRKKATARKSKKTAAAIVDVEEFDPPRVTRASSRKRVSLSPDIEGSGHKVGTRVVARKSKNCIELDLESPSPPVKKKTRNSIENAEQLYDGKDTNVKKSSSILDLTKNFAAVGLACSVTYYLFAS